ncbi:2366_t:CDS:2 [Funneliformis mosseae]|uniref:RING-type E3 ubiquitin transferase n=1 Tax=Funneliformis mosseae TaxID=27381 RepID=A0A9N8YS32_FUNMO|nr:2366_t:CDS:2 [Funneliformis mosseae]
MGIDLLEQEIANETSEPVRDLNREVNGNGILEMTEIDQAQYPEEPFTNELTENNVPVLRNRGGSTLQMSTKSSKSANFVTGLPSTTSSSAGEGSSRAVRSSQSKTNDIHTNNSNSEYECNICFDTASSPVLTLCGHLFCWPCLHQWLEAQYQNPLCPVCKAGCGQDKVIPIYGRGKEAKDPRQNSDIPNRPAGQRPQPQRDPNQPGAQFFPVSSFHSNAFGPHFSISASAIFPSLFGAQFTFPPPNGPPSPQQAFVSRLLLMLAILFSLCFYFIR